MVTETNRAYHSSPAVSRSKLHLMSRTPKYYKWAIENPREPSDSMKFGTAFHKFVLEPETFADEIAIRPIVNLRTNDGKAQMQAFLEMCEQENKTDISQAQYETILKMAESIKQEPYAALVLVGDHEKSFYWTDSLTGIECKCRPDSFRRMKENSRILIVDLKSCDKADDVSIRRDIVKYGYDLQSYMQCKGVSEDLHVPVDNIDFMFVFVEKDAPFMVNVLQVDEFVLERGETLFREYIGMLKYCTDSNNWYGYNGADGKPNVLSLPKYLMKEINIEDN